MDEQQPQINTIVPPAAPPAAVPPAPASDPAHKKTILISLVAGGAALIGIGIFLFFWLSSPKDVEVTVTVPEQVQSGIPFPLTVAISNESNVDLQDAQIAITLPQSFVFVGPGNPSTASGRGKTFENKQLGGLEKGRLAKEDFHVLPLEHENTIQQMKVVVSYVPGALRSRFEKPITKDIIVGEKGAVLDVIPPTSVFANQPFTTEIQYRNTSSVVIQNAVLHAIYPSGFVFSSAEPAPSGAASASNSSWSLGTLNPGAIGTIKLVGSLVGQTAAVFEFRLDLSADIGGQVYTINEKSENVSIASSPLGLSISLGGGNSAVSPGTFLTYNLNYENNTEIGLKDVIITAKLTGEMFDLTKFKSDGALQSAINTAAWNASRVPALAFLAPGARGTVSFNIPIKPDYPIKRLSSKNFTLRVDGRIESPTVPRNISAEKTVGVAMLENKIRGRLAIDSAVYFHDAGSGILNKGSLPPRVGQPVQYTVHWVLKNFATDADGAVVKAFLGPNVRFTGQAKTNIDGGSLPSYNDRTQEVTWQVGKVPANRGILSPAYEAIFQIEFTPSSNQAETAPVLIRETQLNYQDLFTLESLTERDNEVQSQERVIQ